MALAEITIPSDGSTTLLAVDFALGYIDPAHITCHAGDESDGAGNPIYRSFTVHSSGMFQVNGGAIPVGQNWVFTRTVPKDELIVDWEDGDPITEENLNTAQKQAIMLAHEALDLGNRAIKAPVGVDGPNWGGAAVGDMIIMGQDNTLIGAGIEPGTGNGDMLKAIYDPTNRAVDVFLPASHGVFDTAALFAAATIPSTISQVKLLGYSEVGDGGEHRKVRVSTPPVPQAWHSQSADGAWWEIVLTDKSDVRNYGAKGDGSTNDANAVLAAYAAVGIVYAPFKTWRVNVTQANIDTLLTALTKTVGDGTMDVFFGAGLYTTNQQWNQFDSPNSKYVFRGESIVGALSAASVTIAGTAGAYTAAITFAALPAGIAIGQLLSVVPTAINTSADILAGSHKITNIVGNVVTVAIPYHAGFTVLTGTISVTGTYELQKSIINYTSFRAFLSVRSSNVDITVRSLGLQGPYTSGVAVNTVGIAIGEFNTTTFALTDSVKIENVGINGFAYGILVQGGRPVIRNTAIAACYQGIQSSRNADVYLAGTYITSCVNTGIQNEGASVFSAGRIIASGNGGRGIWNFNAKFFSTGVATMAYNNDAGLYGKAGSTIYLAATSAARWNNNIGFGVENSVLSVIGTLSEDNRVTGYEAGAGAIIDATSTISRRNEQGYYCLINATIEAFYAEAHNNLNNGFVAAESGCIRGKESKSHHNGASGYAVIRNGEMRLDLAQSYNNTGSGYRADQSGVIHAPGATSTSNGAADLADVLCSIYLGSAYLPGMFQSCRGDLIPAVDNAQRCGNASFRWSNIYATTGSVQTSDERNKQDIQDVPDAVLDAIAKIDLRLFRFKDAVERKGGEARIHSGILAQQIDEAFSLFGLNAYDYGLFCYDEWDAEYTPSEHVDKITGEVMVVEPRLIREAGNLYGVRYEEFLVLEAAVQRRRADRLEARMSALEALLIKE